MAGYTHSVTALLHQLNAGDPGALSRLIEAIYPELRKLARARLNGERSGQMLQSRELVNEIYLRLVAHRSHSWQGRAHFFAAASNLMRRALVDVARSRRAQKRGTGEIPLALEDEITDNRRTAVNLIALDDALDVLERLSPRQARIVHLRYFGGLSIPEVAEVLSIAPRTVVREWAVARAWLRLQLTS